MKCGLIFQYVKNINILHINFFSFHYIIIDLRHYHNITLLPQLQEVEDWLKAYKEKEE